MSFRAGTDAIALRVTALGKRYQLQGRGERYQMLRESLARTAVDVMHRAGSLFRARQQPPEDDRTFWALRDVSFSVEAGEIVGVIGNNGAGKSTLLKILSRITAPTVGRAEVRGRVGSLLEVGTGFHPELTGRENVLLSGVILGMRRAEVLRSFDTIVAFAGVERFIDTPVKRYSSGMYLRLAFAVAAHLEPDILFVDEVLAVGDAAFQRKCLGKMSEVARGGRTVLFVSHNMVAVQSLCSRAIWLQAGHLEQIGDTRAVVADYLKQSAGDEADRVWGDASTAPGNEWVTLQRARIRPADGAEMLSVHTPFSIEIEYWSLREAQLAATLHLFNEAGVLVFSAGPSPEQVSRAPMSRGLFRDTCRIPGDLLNDGVHRAELFVMRGSEIVLHQADFLSFTVRDSPSLRGGWMGKWPGAVRPNLTWTTDFLGPPT